MESLHCTDCTQCIKTTSPRDEKTSKDLQTRLSRVEGQVRGIKTMVEKDSYCDDILTQMSAVQSALNSISKIILDSHIRTCVASRLAKQDPDITEELIKTIGRLLYKGRSS